LDTGGETVSLQRQKDGKYCDMEKEHKVLQKLLQECFLPKGGGVDHLSLDHKVFLHYFISFEKVNLPRYIFHYMLWALEQSQQKNRAFVPYERLLSEIFHQGGMLEVLKMSKAVNDNQLGTMVGKYINGSTLYNMHLVKAVISMDTDLQESNILSNLMDNFPPICKQDPPDVRAHYMYEHWKTTRETIKYSDIPSTMYGGSLPVASKKRKSKKKATSEADDEEASEPKKKKAKKAKDAPQEQLVGYEVPIIQDEVQDLEPAKILNKRTRSDKTVGSSQSLPPQPSIAKNKRKKNVRKLKVSIYVTEEDEKIEAASNLVTREVKMKKPANAAALQKALDIAKDIEVPVEALLKESTIEAAHKVIELTEDLQELVMASDLLNSAEETQKEDVTCLEATASEATRGNSNSHNISNVIEIESSSTSTSHSTSVSTSSDIDNIPLNKVYATLHKSLSPSSSTKHQKKPDGDTFVPMYPSVLNRIADLSQMRIDVCNKLSTNHPMQPPMIEPLQTILVDAEFLNEQAVPEPNIPETSSSQPQPSTQTCELNLEKASELASDEITLESPQQQEPNSEMATNTYTELIIHLEYQPYHLNATHSNISFGIALRKLTNKKSSTSNLPASDDQPSSLENQIPVVQPISVAQPSTETTLNPAELEQMIIEHVVDEVSTHNGTTLPSSSPFVLEHINDPPYVPNRPVATKVTSSTLNTAEPTSILALGEPSATNSTQLTDITFPPTLLLDSIILK